MRNTQKRALSALAGVAALGLLVGCSAGGSAAPEESAAPVSIDIWGWDAETTQQVVDAYNASQDKVTVNYVLQASNAATQTNFRNVMESGSGVPCWVPGTGPIATALVNGWAQDITEYVTPLEDRFSDGALAAARIDGKYYGFPTGPSATFMMANTKVYEDNGLEIPATWEDFVEVGKQLNAKGVKVINLAGEDPSTLLQLAQQAGANWFEIDGDTWKVNFLDDNSKKAAGIVQDLVDNDLVSNQTYQDRAALYSFFDSDQLATIPLAWWSAAGYQTNFTNTLGQWHATQIPQFEGADEFVTSGFSDPGFVPVGCEHPEAAVDFETWANTSPEGIDAGVNQKTGAIAFPASLKDVSGYTEAVVPDTLFDEPAAAVGKVITDAQTSSLGAFERGPDYDAWFPELQDQWGKAMVKEITVEQALQNVQDFVAKDLESKGINYEVAN